MHIHAWLGYAVFSSRCASGNNNLLVVSALGYLNAKAYYVLFFVTSNALGFTDYLHAMLSLLTQSTVSA